MKQTEQEKVEIFWDWNGKREPIVLEELVGLVYGIIGFVLTLHFLVGLGMAVVGFNITKYSKGGRKR